MDDVGAIEGRTEHSRLRNLPAIAATDAILIDKGHRIVFQRIVGMFERQGRTAREADAGVIASANVGVDAEFLANHAFARAHRLGEHRTNAALLVQHALR